jgi:hypothetical protein
MPERDPSVEVRAAARTVGTAIADGMTSSGYHTKRHEPYVLEFESGGALVHYSLSERANDVTFVLAKVTPPEGFNASDRAFRRYQLSAEVQRFLDGIRSALEAAAAKEAAGSAPKSPEPAPSPAPPTPSAPPPPDRPGKVLKKLGL